jgi:hypothetical protein
VPPSTLTLNVPQTIFTILFAVFAGTAASAQPRWKAFAWAHAFREGPAFWRCVLSVAVLNVLPLLFFSFTIVRLGGDFLQPSQWDARAMLQILFAAAPAFSAFAFYRLWIAVVLCSPKTFYRLDAEGKPPPDFALEPDDLDRANLRGNLAASVLYLMLGAFPLLYSFIFRR